MNAAKWIGAVLVVLGALVAPFLYWVHGNIALFALLISVVGFVLIFADATAAQALAPWEPLASIHPVVKGVP